LGSRYPSTWQRSLSFCHLDSWLKLVEGDTFPSILLYLCFYQNYFIFDNLGLVASFRMLIAELPLVELEPGQTTLTGQGLSWMELTLALELSSIELTQAAQGKLFFSGKELPQEVEEGPVLAPGVGHAPGVLLGKVKPVLHEGHHEEVPVLLQTVQVGVAGVASTLILWSPRK
jgi:hypothetical protein